MYQNILEYQNQSTYGDNRKCVIEKIWYRFILLTMIEIKDLLYIAN